MQSLLECATCHQALKKELKCGACKAVYYCGVECQRIDWKKTHKNDCKRIQQARKEAEENANLTELERATKKLNRLGEYAVQVKKMKTQNDIELKFWCEMKNIRPLLQELKTLTQEQLLQFKKVTIQLTNGSEIDFQRMTTTYRDGKLEQKQKPTLLKEVLQMLPNVQELNCIQEPESFDGKIILEVLNEVNLPRLRSLAVSVSTAFPILDLSRFGNLKSLSYTSMESYNNLSCVSTVLLVPQHQEMDLIRLQGSYNMYSTWSVQELLEKCKDYNCASIEFLDIDLKVPCAPERATRAVIRQQVPDKYETGQRVYQLQDFKEVKTSWAPIQVIKYEDPENQNQVEMKLRCYKLLPLTHC